MVTPPENMTTPVVENQSVKKVDETETKVSPNRKRLLWAVTAGFMLIALIGFLFWLFYFQFHESTDDAYANGNMVNIHSAISGSVTAFYVDDTQRVEQGQLLVTLDKTPYQVAYDKGLADLADVVLTVRQFYDNVKALEAVVENKEVTFKKAQFDLENRAKLISSKAVSNEEYIHAQDTLKIAELDLKQSKMQLQVAKDAAGNTTIENHPRINQQKATVLEAYYKLQHCSIYAPATGYIAQRSVEVGQWIVPTTALMTVIPTDYVWVDANFKETQLTYMRVGQPAEVWFDMYGSSVKFNGKVIGIASGSGSIFSLIPPQNATGNWIKIVQRLPVRISLDPEVVRKYPIRLGISAQIDVNTSQRDLPMLTSQTQSHPLATTSVFDIDLEKANKIVESIVQSNMKINDE